jgi:hypothetical protein
MRFDPRIVPALFATVFFAMPLAAQAQAAALDGRVFVADAGVKGKAADEKNDVISFNGGKFHSSSCDQYGYGKGWLLNPNPEPQEHWFKGKAKT